MTVNIKITHPDIGERIVKTRNVSDGGIFIVIDPSEVPEPGEVVEGQVQGVIEDAPILEMVIVRIEKDGVGLQYVADG